MRNALGDARAVLSSEDSPTSFGYATRVPAQTARDIEASLIKRALVRSRDSRCAVRNKTRADKRALACSAATRPCVAGPKGHRAVGER
eukprot:2748065-Pyramimonas_sp.AAC.1